MDANSLLCVEFANIVLHSVGCFPFHGCLFYCAETLILCNLTCQSFVCSDFVHIQENLPYVFSW